LKETPRTDAEESRSGKPGLVDSDFARQMELELQAAHETIAQLIDCGNYIHKVLTIKYGHHKHEKVILWQKTVSSLR
jgi:hypothetical protein